MRGELGTGKRQGGPLMVIVGRAGAGQGEEKAYKLCLVRRVLMVTAFMGVDRHNVVKTKIPKQNQAKEATTKQEPERQNEQTQTSFV